MIVSYVLNFIIRSLYVTIRLVECSKPPFTHASNTRTLQGNYTTVTMSFIGHESFQFYRYSKTTNAIKRSTFQLVFMPRSLGRSGNPFRCA